MADTPVPPSTSERRDVSARGLFIFGGGFIAFMAVALASLFYIYGAPTRGLGNAKEAVAPVVAETTLRAQRLQFEAAEEAQLESFGWIDRSAGIARIPIEDALRIVASEGLPQWSAGDAETVRGAVPRLPRDSSGWLPK